jgi:putative transcriptional regulator
MDKASSPCAKLSSEVREASWDGHHSPTAIWLASCSLPCLAGAMGLVINRILDALTFGDLLEQLGIASPPTERAIHVHFGGPVETGRGFVLHTPDYRQDGTLLVADDVALTATVDILRAIAVGKGPRQHLLALGYAGWGPGQLDGEIRGNGWLHVAADEALVFDRNLDSKWDRAMAKIGIDPRMLSDAAGHA